MTPLIFSNIVTRTWLVLCLLTTIMGIQAWSLPSGMTMLTTPNTTKPGCLRKCGNLTIPYPFGVGYGSGCSRSEWYDIICMASSEGVRAKAKAYFMWATIHLEQAMEIVDISETQIRLRNDVAIHCFNLTNASSVFYDITIYNMSAPFSVSSTSNKLFAVGCHDFSKFYGNFDPESHNLDSPSEGGCGTNCSANDKNVVPGKCNGAGCCQAAFSSKGLRYVSVGMGLGTNHTSTIPFNPCGYAFLGDPERFHFRGASDLLDSGFADRVRNEVPLVLEWVIGNHTCAEAQQNRATYACQQNTTCENATESGIRGYHCSCLPGYQGNPYLDPGCSDINECEDRVNSPCSKNCVNTPGNYTCSCLPGYSGDGRKDGGIECKRNFPVLQVGLGVGFGSLLLAIGISWLCCTIRKRRKIEMKEKFFQNNGGLLLKQLISSNKQDNMEVIKVFTMRELKVATKNFSDDTIVGRGGYGTVYKGILPNNQIVAIKRSKFLDQSQIEQFINELVILARIRHPNVVRLIGCCLEAEIPMLVYEFISNGTLYDHIHKREEPSWYSWINCLRIASESASAFAYLHSIPIIHRDIKSMNILLDECYTTKVADFGASRLIPLNQTHISTVVQGTLGYLDPEYFFSSQLTEKSDVYSYGVVLTELLTRARPISPERQKEENNYNLAAYFIKCFEEGNLFNILDSQLVAEASQEQLISIAKLVQKCLSVKGEDRPTMKEVARELERLWGRNNVLVQ